MGLARSIVWLSIAVLLQAGFVAIWSARAPTLVRRTSVLDSKRSASIAGSVPHKSATGTPARRIGKTLHAVWMLRIEAAAPVHLARELRAARGDDYQLPRVPCARGPPNDRSI